MTTTVGNDNMLRLRDSIAGWHESSRRAEYKRAWHHKPKPAPPHPWQPLYDMTTDELADEITFLLDAGQGLARTIQAVGYAGHPEALLKRLERNGKHDVARRLRPKTLDQMLARP